MYRCVRARGILLMIALGALLVLAACGGSAVPATPPSLPSATVSSALTAPPASAVAPTTVPTPTATSVSTVGLATSRPSTGPGATLPSETFGRNCGDVEIRGADTVNGPAARQAAECFWQLYQRGCGPGAVVLRVTQSGTGPTVTREFSLSASGGGCTIQVRQEQSPSRPTTTLSCAGLTRESDGALHFRVCGADGDIIVAAPKL